MKGIFFYFITALFLLNLSGQQKTTLGQKLNFINQLESYYSNITIYENSKRLSNQNFLKNQFDLILEKQKQINLKPEELLKNETDWLEFTGKSSSFLFFNSFADESIKKNALEQAFEIVELDVKKLLKNKLDKKKFENSSLQGSQLEQAMNLAYYSWFSQRLGQAFVRRFDKIANQYLPYVRKGLTYSSAIPKSIIQYCLQNNKYEDVKILSLKYDYLLESEHKRQLNLIEFKKKIQNNNPTNSDIISDYTAYFELYYDLMSLNLKYSDKLHDIATKLIKSYNEEPNSLNFKSLPKLEKNQARRIINYLVEATKDNQDWRIFYNLGLFYLKQDNVFKSKVYLQKAVKLSINFETLYAFGLIEMKLENYPSAYYHLKLASYWKNNNIELLNNLAICAQYVNDKTIIAPASLYYINKAIELNEDNFNLYKTRANIQKKLGNDKEYLNNLKEAYRILKGITSENSVKYINILGVKYQSEVKNAVGKEIKKLEKIIEK